MDSIKGAFKSWTVLLGVLTALAPYSDQIVGIASGISPVAGAVLSTLIILVRARTKGSLADKVQ